jgi:hypothetical protein
MNKLTINGNSYIINNGKSFENPVAFKVKTIDKVFDFAYEMSFGFGEHRDHRTGGSLNRKKGQIFINTFQGKLSELAVYNIFFINNKNAYDRLSNPDFDVYGLGEWDDSDIILDNIKFSIKSTKFYGNLLLLETKDWNSNGEYIPNLNKNRNGIYDYFILVRIKPDGEKIMRNDKLLYSNNIDKYTLHSMIKREKWEYDIAGYITKDDLKLLIHNDFILPKNSMLNGKIKMDAENYYIQSADMKDFQTLVSSL